MIFATYQPKDLGLNLRRPAFKALADHLGYLPVFCFPARCPDEFAKNSLLSSASYPQMLHLFDTESYIPIDAIAWRQLAISGDEITDDAVKKCLDNPRQGYEEYLVNPSNPAIKRICSVSLADYISHPGSVVSGIDVSISANSAASRIPDDMIRQMFETATRYISLALAQAHVNANPQMRDIPYKEEFTRELSRYFIAQVLGGYENLWDVIPLTYASDAGDPFTQSKFSQLEVTLDDSLDGANPTYEAYDSASRDIDTLLDGNYDYLMSNYYHMAGNSPCFCGSGRKFKKCHKRRPQQALRAIEELS